MKKTVCILAAMLAAVLTGTVSADENLASFVSKDKVWHYTSVPTTICLMNVWTLRKAIC